MMNINFQVVTVQHGHQFINQFMWVRKQKEDLNGRPLQIFSKKDTAIAP